MVSDKTEKTHAGTLVEIALARALRLADGTTLDYTIAGADVDCKFSHRLGGWMVPPEAEGKLLLLVQASDEDGTWSAGLLRAAGENLRPAGNRDGKRGLGERGRAAVRWLHARAPLQENALIRLPERDATAVFALPSGQQRVNELFRRAQRMRVSRTVVATVAMQDDYMKRVRGGGGARDQLRAEGIVIFGDYAGDQVLASALGLPRPGPASSSARGWPGARAAPAAPGALGAEAPAATALGAAARAAEAPVAAPAAGTAAAGAGIMPVRSGSRAPTGCLPAPPIRPRPRPRCPADPGKRRSSRADTAETLASRHADQESCGVSVSVTDGANEQRGSCRDIWGQRPGTALQPGQISRIGERI